MALRASNTQPAIVTCESSTIEGLRIQKENVKNELLLVKIFASRQKYSLEN